MTLLILAISFFAMTESIGRKGVPYKFRDYLRYKRDGIVIGVHALPKRTAAKLRRLRPKNVVANAKLRRRGMYTVESDPNRDLIAKSHSIYRANGGRSASPVFISEDELEDDYYPDDDDYYVEDYGDEGWTDDDLSESPQERRYLATRQRRLGRV